MYDKAGTHTWTKPDDIDDKPILVHVWGAGGTGGVGSTSYGGGGRWISRKADQCFPALNATETVTIGTTAGAVANQNLSFGSHCSATGGNGGTCRRESKR